MPFGPVARLVGPVSVTATASRLGVDRRQVYRWREGGLTVRAADRVALALGLHPVLVWAEWVAVW